MAEGKLKKAKVIVHAVAEGKHAMHGRATWNIHCSCGRVNLFFAWSWAGHSFAICKGCKNKIKYRTLEVVQK